MYRPPSKRKQLIQRTAVYSFMTIAVVSLVTVLVLVMLGYQFNRNEGRIEQGGLLQFDSRPNGANVTIDGNAFGTRTPSKTTLSSGQHFITMTRTGYQTWQKSVDIVPGSVTWLNYSRLIPVDLQPSSVADFSRVSSTAVSQDAKWMAIKENAADASIRLANLTGDDVSLKTIDIPTTVYTKAKKHVFTIEKWDPDSRYILVQHTYDTKREWLVVDAENVGASQNVSRLLDIDASKIVFSDGDSRVLYAQIGTDIRRINLSEATMSRPLVDNAADFSLYKTSTIVFTTTQDTATKQKSVGFYKEGADKPQIVRSYDDSKSTALNFAIGEYFGDTYFAISNGHNVEVFESSLDDVTKAKPVANFTASAAVDHLSIVTNGRFIIVQHGAAYTTYDLEFKKSTSTQLKGTSAVNDELRWLDNYTVWSDRDGMVRLYEFDGANQHDIMPVVPGLSVTLSPNATYIYGINKTNDGAYHLQRVRLLLP
jgi:outer membrane lipoprotein-sorting protein